MHQKFNPGDWLPSDLRSELNLVVYRIEVAHIDITGTYANWLNLGFALADELGEGGRDYFHRLSRFYPKYSYTDCNRQFDHCLKSKGHGITIKTLFHLAKEAGIEIGRWGENERGRKWENEIGVERRENPPSDLVLPSPDSGLPSLDSVLPSPSSGLPSPDVVALPTLPESVYETLPEFLKRVVARSGTPEEKDLMLLGALGTLSACLPKVFGIYDEAIVYANLYVYITSPASAGKGRLVNCKRLVNPIHASLRRQSQSMKAQYELEVREYNLQKAKGFNLDKPVRPTEKMLFVPANNSSAGIFQLLAGNDGCGLIFETEAETMVHSLKSEHGDYTDFMCKGAHHEAITYYRKTDREFEEIENPRISLVLSSTPKQVVRLIPSAENGLLSRIIFYQMNIHPVWKEIFPETPHTNLKVYYDQLGQEFYPLYKALLDKPEIEFCLSREQKKQFHAFFTQIQEKYLMLQGMDYIATIRRLGLIFFRIAMIFTTLRILETGDFSQKQECRDEDFQAALAMIKVLVRHASHVFSQLPEQETAAKPKNKREQFLEMLPETFNRPEFIELAQGISIAARTADKYISDACAIGLIKRERNNVYTKTKGI